MGQDRTDAAHGTHPATGPLAGQDPVRPHASQAGARAAVPDAKAYPGPFADLIGPRFPGTVYHNGVQTFEVLAVLFGEQAREHLPYSAWALVVRHRATGEVLAHRFAWTTSDWIISQPTHVREAVTSAC